VPAECRGVIPYTSYPNERFGLYTEEDYRNLSAQIASAAEGCSDAESVRVGACQVLFPRCLMGYSLYPCRATCLGNCRCERCQRFTVGDGS
jgi:hypothetical protein